MAGLQTYSYPGFGEFVKKNLNYSQAIRVENRILCSGQGGWDPNADLSNVDEIVKKDLMEEIDQAFANVDMNLKHAGGKGFQQVYKIVTYSTSIKAQHDRIVANLKKWMPDHQPIWTELGISHLGLDTMNIEIDVEAYDP